MAKTFLTNINLKGNQLLNAVIHSASSAPSALAAGQLYFNTGDSTFYYSTGTGTGNWSPVGVQYISTVGSNLSVTGGELDLGANVVITDSTQTLSNKTISGPLYFTDNVTVANEGEIVINSDNNNFEITAVTNDLVLGSNNGNIILSADSDIYKGSINANNRIATFGDLAAGSVQSVSGTTNQINVTMNGEAATIALTDSVNINTGLTLGGAFSENNGTLDVRNGNNVSVFQIDSNGNINNQYHGYSTYTNATGLINVNSFINLSSEGNPPAGFLFVNANSGASEYPTLHLEANGDLALRAGANGNDGNIILYTGSTSGPGTGKVYIGWNNAGGAGANASNQVATIGDLNSVQSGLTWKQAVNVHIDSAEAINLNVFVSGDPGSEVLTSALTDGLLIIDGHTITNADSGYRILVTGTNSTKDGIWTVNAVALNNWTASRTVDADTFAELKGAAVFVMEGTKYASTSWVQNNHYITDFTGQVWNQFSGQGTYIGSNSILIDGNEVSVILDSDSLEITGSGLKVNPSTTGGLDIDGGLYVRTGAGLKIESNDVQIDYTSLESQLVTDGFVKSTDISDVTRKYSVDITPATPFSNTTFTITHNLGTSDVIARVYQTYGPDNGADVEVDIKRTSTNALTVSFAAAPASGETYTVVVIG